MKVLKFLAKFLQTIVVIILMIILTALWAFAHEGVMGPWFKSLSSTAGGACCGPDDGTEDVDWEDVADPQRPQIAYLVTVDLGGGPKKVEVPLDAVVKTPNLFGRAMFWGSIIRDTSGNETIRVRCFMPGTRG